MFEPAKVSANYIMSITIYIIILTCAISFTAWNKPDWYHALIFNPYTIFKRNQWYRMFSSALLHADLTHLFINMFVLYSFGEYMETVYTAYLPMGQIMYLVMYVLAIAAANIKTLIENRHNAWYNAVGASGAVSAVIFSFILVAPLEKILFFMVLPIPAFIYGILYLIYSQYMANKASDNIGHDAHFFGAVFGFVFTGLLRPELFTNFMNQILHR